MKKLIAILLTVVLLFGTLSVAATAFFAAPMRPGPRPVTPRPVTSTPWLNGAAPAFEQQGTQRDTSLHVGGRQFNATRIEHYTVRERDRDGNMRDVARTRTVWVNRNIRYNGHNATSRHHLSGGFVSLTASVGRVDGTPRVNGMIEFWGDGELLERIDVPMDGTRGASVGLQGVRILEIRVVAPNASQQPAVALINPVMTSVPGISPGVQHEYEQRVAQWEQQAQRREAWEAMSTGQQVWQQVLSGTAFVSAGATIGLFVYGMVTHEINYVLWSLLAGFIWMITGTMRIFGRV